ncbi:MAG TPA: hypothetical protein VI140_12375 [Oxalicibacterium sp.]
MEQLQAFILLLHGDIQQDDCDMRFRCQEFPGLLRRVSVQKCQWPALYFNAVESGDRCGMYIRIVVDDQNLPWQIVCLCFIVTGAAHRCFWKYKVILAMADHLAHGCRLRFFWGSRLETVYCTPMRHQAMLFPAELK